MASNESSSVPARLKDLKDSVKERFLGLLGIRQPKVLLEDEQEVYLQVGRTVWHAPRQLRIELWLSSLARRHSLVSEYQTYLSQEISREAACDIEKDVQRTFPNTRRFHAEEGQTQLRNVLRAYAAYDPEVGYCQGMNFLTGLLLMYMPSEAQAFAALVVLMEDRKLRSFYHRSMSLLQVQLWQLSRLISPSLNQHLEALGVVPMLYGASWLMTAFSADFPIPFSARIMDVLLADQCECALLKVAAAIMKAVSARLREMRDLEDVLGYLKIDVPGWDEAELHDLLTAAFTKPWTARQLTILRSTEGAETVAQAMDRVMTMNEQLSATVCDEEETAEDGAGDGDARVAVTIPRLQPPPQPSNSFTASPACGTPVNGGMYGTGSHGGGMGVGSPPAAAAAGGIPVGSAKCSGGGGAASAASALLGSSSGGSTSGGNGRVLLQNTVSMGTSPATWAIPCIHPNVPASPAIQAFRRAHLPCLHDAVSGGGAPRNSGAFHFPPASQHRSSIPARSSCGGVLNSGDGSGGLDDAAAAEAIAAADETGASAAGGFSPQKSCPSPLRRGSDGCALEEWGEFNAAAVRQQWRSIVRAAPGSTRHVLMHAATGEDFGGGNGPWVGVVLPPPLTPGSRGSSGGSASQPIPVPLGRSATSSGSGSGSACIGSAFAAAAAAAAVAAGLPSTSAPASGKPPLPPRCTSLDRASPVASVAAAAGGPLLGPFSRLSVVAEDPLAVQIGPTAPAPSPRGSMDLHVLGRSASQQLEAYEQQGLLLCGTSVGGAAGAAGAVGSATGGGSASCNGDFVSGTASATTGGVLLSPSGVSGAMSPHGLSSPRVTASWCTSGPAGGGISAAGATASGTGSAIGTACGTPTAGYVPLGMERLASGSMLDLPPACTAGMAGTAVLAAGEPSFGSMPSAAVPPLPLPPSAAFAASVGEYLELVDEPGPSEGHLLEQQQQHQHQQGQEADPPSDMATDIAGDILRMLSAVDTGSANVAYDPRVILGESMYADSPNKEEHKLVRQGSEHLRHLPSSSALAELAAQDLARAQAEAERVRLELEAQLQQQRASASCSAPMPGTDPTTGSAATASADTLTASPSACNEGHVASRTEGLAAAAAAAGAGDSHPAVPLSPVEAAADGGDTAGEAPSGATGATSTASGGGGNGAEELVFRRPTLYVDGIPMFDPKSLMEDHHEAQVMFTPTVSPGASSYADPVLAGFTPTGDGAAPVAEGDGGAAEGDGFGDDPGVGAAEKWQLLSECRPSEGGEEMPLNVAAAAGDIDDEEDEREGCTAGPATAGLTPPSEVAVVAVVAAPRPAVAPAASVPYLACSAAAAAAAATTTTDADGVSAAVTELVAGDQLQTLPSASEWVDWSQAPPIQAAAAVVLPLDDELNALVSPTEAAEAEALPSPSADTAAAAGPDSASPPPLPITHTEPAPERDLIDMASPARPLMALSHFASQPVPSAAGGGDSGTGLSPGPPAAATAEALAPVRHTSSISFSDLAGAGVGAAGGAASGSGSPLTMGSSASSMHQPLAPYGLLPNTSSAVNAPPPPVAPVLSFASSVAGPTGFGLAGGACSAAAAASFSGPPRPNVIDVSDPQCESPSVDVNLGTSHAADGTAVQILSARAGSGYGDAVHAHQELDGGGHGVAAGGSPSSLPPAPLPLPPSPLSGSRIPSEEAMCCSPTLASEQRQPLPTTGDLHPSEVLAKPAMMLLGEDDASTSGGDKAAAALGLLVVAEAVAGQPLEATTPQSWDSPAARASGGGGLGPGGGGGGASDSSISFGDQRRAPPPLPPRPPMRTAGSCDGGGDLDAGGGSESEAKTPGPVAGSGGGSWSTGLGLGFGSGAASRGSMIEHQGSCDVDMEGDEVESSPFRAALSPSLAHHIMSAYLRSEQHQQQQEQRELQERLQQEQHQEHAQHQQLLSASGASAADHTELAEAGNAPMDAEISVAAAAPPPPPPVAPAAPLGGAASAFGAVVAHLAVVEELSLCGLSTTTAGGVSGVASPMVGSPGRSGAPYNSYGAATQQQHHQHLQQAAAKALTPFAVSLDDPTVCHLSAEVLSAMPPPPIVLQPDTPTPLYGLAGSGGGAQPAADSRAHASGRTSLRCTASGDGGDGLTCMTSGGGAAAAAAAVGAFGSGLIRMSGGGSGQPMSLLGQGSHDGAAAGSSTALGLHAATATTASALQAGCSVTARAAAGGTSSTGGAVPPLLPPPPPPQVPLCSTLCTASVRLEAVSAPPPAVSASIPPLPLPPVLCSSSATVLCVNSGGSGAAAAAGATCTPVAGAGGAAGGLCAATAASCLPQPTVPNWTATFDGVDDGAAAAGDNGPESAPASAKGPEPRALSSAFAAEADTPPQQPARGSYSCGGDGDGSTTRATTTGVSSAGTGSYTPDGTGAVLRALSLEPTGVASVPTTITTAGEHLDTEQQQPGAVPSPEQDPMRLWWTP